MGKKKSHSVNKSLSQLILRIKVFLNYRRFANSPAPTACKMIRMNCIQELTDLKEIFEFGECVPNDLLTR